MTTRGSEQMRGDALAIWLAGVEAVRPSRLVRDAVRVEGGTFWIGGEPLALAQIGRIAVVGGGKACGAMAVAVEEALGDKICLAKQLHGWVNVPADCVPADCVPPDCVPPGGKAGSLRSVIDRVDTLWPPTAVAPRFIHLHPGRPAGVNEPRPEGVVGTAEILRLVASLGPNDLCLCLIGGGGSALLPAPADGVTLDDKIALTRALAAAGANIRQLNTVRKHLSRIKGGGLARACRAGRLIGLIISDVIGDPLSVIASGPTVPDETTAADALAVLDALGLRNTGVAPSAIAYLQARVADPPLPPAAVGCRVTNLIIGRLATAVDAAGAEASRRGYQAVTETAALLEGPAEEVGYQLADRAAQLRGGPGPDCLVSGGEPVVVLVDLSRRGLGGRNQQLALAAGLRLQSTGTGGCLVLSGGTDGEDGPTDAAGAFVDAELLADAARRGFDPADFLARNDAYHFFDPLGGLVRTGPTHTNVGDLRVVLVAR